MTILLGIITFLTGLIAPIAIKYFTEVDFINLGVAFIIPAGPIAIGIMMGFIFYKGLILMNKKIDRKMYITGGLIALICFCAITYADYYMTRVDAEGYTIYSITGSPLSDYEADGYGQMTFFNYMRYTLDTSSLSFSHRSTDLGSVSNPILNYGYFVLNIAGIIWGFISIGMKITKNKVYCDDCQKYKQVLESFKIKKESFEEAHFQIQSLNQNSDQGESLEKYLQTLRSEEVDLNESHVGVYFYHCDAYNHAEIAFHTYEVNKKGKFSIKFLKDKSMPIDRGIVVGLQA